MKIRQRKENNMTKVESGADKKLNKVLNGSEKD